MVLALCGPVNLSPSSDRTAGLTLAGHLPAACVDTWGPGEGEWSTRHRFEV